MLAEWAAIAIGNARLYEDVARRGAELERAVRGLEATATVARAVGFETDLDRVLELVVKRGRALVDADSLLVFLEEDDELRVAAAAGEIGAEAVGVDAPAGGHAARRRADERHVGARGEPGRPRWGTASTRSPGMPDPRSWPRSASATALAACSSRSNSGRGSRGFEPDEDHLLTSFGASAAIAIATAQSVEAERLKHSIRASESERSRWARELHDETLQELGALKVMLESAHRSWTARSRFRMPSSARSNSSRPASRHCRA